MVLCHQVLVSSWCFYCLFLMMRRPPRSTRTDTLFPYTTLFRSQWTMVLGLGGEYTKLSGFNTAYTYPSAATPSLSRISAQREFFNVAPEAALRWQPAAAWTLHARVSGGYGTPQIGNL